MFCREEEEDANRPKGNGTDTHTEREAMASCVLTRCPDGASPSAFFGMLQARGTVSADERRGGERVLFWFLLFSFLFSHVIFPEFQLPFSDAKVNHKEKDEMG